MKRTLTFVKKKNRRILEQAPSNGHSLLLPSTQLQPSLADLFSQNQFKDNKEQKYSINITIVFHFNGNLSMKSINCAARAHLSTSSIDASSLPYLRRQQPCTLTNISDAIVNTRSPYLIL